MHVAAQGMAFDTSTITVPAGSYVTIRFNNADDGIPHNIAVYDSPAAMTTLFQGTVINGPQTTSYSFFAPATVGTYFFRCDIHPASMTGDFIVVPTVSAEVTARQMAFDVSAITVPVGAYVMVHFTNSDSGVPHNMAFYDSALARTTFFQGVVITGPAVADYAFFAPTVPGTYVFRCDIHPASMNGEFVVRGGS